MDNTLTTYSLEMYLNSVRDTMFIQPKKDNSLLLRVT